jgi:hypothetical protein
MPLPMPAKTPGPARPAPTHGRSSRRRARLALATALAAATLASQTAPAGAATSVSSNWSGYAVTGTTFRSVSGTWVEPTASCTSSTATTTASAFWVGLGGDSSASNALEQTGTEADCLADGTVRYSSWYELVPAASVRVRLAVRAGDRITASVRASGRRVTVELRNRTTGTSFTKTLNMAAPDSSSAEWIAEAPATSTPGGETILPLTDFGTVRFTNATATASSGRVGTVADPAWTASRIVLRASNRAGGGRGPFGPFAADAASSAEAIPTKLLAGGTAFAVTWRSVPAGPRTGLA